LSARYRIRLVATSEDHITGEIRFDTPSVLEIVLPERIIALVEALGKKPEARTNRYNQ
jgi:hypothetical protein